MSRDHQELPFFLCHRTDASFSVHHHGNKSLLESPKSQNLIKNTSIICGGSDADTSCEWRASWLLWLHHFQLSNQSCRRLRRRPSLLPVTRLQWRASATGCRYCACLIISEHPTHQNQWNNPARRFLNIYCSSTRCCIISEEINNQYFVHSERSARLHLVLSESTKSNLLDVTSSRNDLKVISWSVVNTEPISQHWSIQNKSIQKPHTAGRKCLFWQDRTRSPVDSFMLLFWNTHKVTTRVFFLILTVLWSKTISSTWEPIHNFYLSFRENQPVWFQVKSTLVLKGL